MHLLFFRLAFPLLLCFTFSGLVEAQQLSTLRFSKTYDQDPLSRVLHDLEQAHGLSFSYLPELIEGKYVNQSFSQATWEELLSELFHRQKIQARAVENSYVVLTQLPPEAQRPWDVCLQLKDERGLPLPYVTASINGYAQSAYTDDEGWCKRTFLATAKDSLHFQFIGYAPMAIDLASATNCNALKLSPSGIELSAITVTEYLTEGIASTPEGREIVIDPQRVSALPGFAENELYRAVQLLPGVNSSDETAGRLNIRGGASDQTQVLWDGINVYATGHFFGMISFFSPDLVDEMRVWRGQADATYGGRLSGVVQLETDRDVVDTVEAGAGINLTHANAYIKVPIISGKSDLQLAGRTSVGAFSNLPTYQSYRDQVFQGGDIADLFSDSFFEDEEEIDSLLNNTEGFNFNEVNGRWHWRFNDNNSLTLSGFSQYDAYDFSVDFPFDSGQIIDRISTSNAGASLTFKRQFLNGGQLQAQAAYSNFMGTGAIGIVFNEEETDEELEERESGLEDLAFRLDYQRPILGRHLLKVGLQHQQLRNYFSLENYEDGIPEEIIEQSNTPGVGNIAYGSFGWRPDSPWRADLGLRLHHYTPTGKLYLEPRLSGSYQLSEPWHLKAGYGHNHQFFGEIIQLDLNQVSNSVPLWVLADGIDLDVSQAREATFGVIGKTKGWILDIEGYYKTISNLPALNLLPNEPDDANFSPGTAKTIGADVLIKKRWPNFRSWVIYSISKSDWQFDEIREEPFSANTDRRHQLKWVNTFEANGWLFSLGWRFNSGVPNIPLSGFTDQFDPMTFNTERTGPDHRLDLSLFYQWEAPQQKGLNAKVGVSLLNIYGRENPLRSSYRVVEEETPFGFESIIEEVPKYGLGFTPNLSVSFSWQ